MGWIQTQDRNLLLNYRLLISQELCSCESIQLLYTILPATPVSRKLFPVFRFAKISGIEVPVIPVSGTASLVLMCLTIPDRIVASSSIYKMCNEECYIREERSIQLLCFENPNVLVFIVSINIISV